MDAAGLGYLVNPHSLQSTTDSPSDLGVATNAEHAVAGGLGDRDPGSNNAGGIGEFERRGVNIESGSQTGKSQAAIHDDDVQRSTTIVRPEDGADIASSMTVGIALVQPNDSPSVSVTSTNVSSDAAERNAPQSPTSPVNTVQEMITFENGFSDGQNITSIAVSNNVITFVSGLGTETYSIVQRGEPLSGFVPSDEAHDPNTGQFYLTDKGFSNQLTGSGNYLMRFARPISSLSVDIIDYRTDGGAQAGDTVALEVFADEAFHVLVATDSITIGENLADGIVQRLSVTNLEVPVLSARIVHSRGDVGTAIDNLTFTTLLPPAEFFFIPQEIGESTWFIPLGDGGFVEMSRPTPEAAVFVETTQTIVESDGFFYRPARVETAQNQEFRLFFRIVDEATGREGDQEYELKPESLENLPEVFMKFKFPNGHYRVFLQHAGSNRQQRILDVHVHDGNVVPENFREQSLDTTILEPESRSSRQSLDGTPTDARGSEAGGAVRSTPGGSETLDDRADKQPGAAMPQRGAEQLAEVLERSIGSFSKAARLARRVRG